MSVEDEVDSLLQRSPNAKRKHRSKGFWIAFGAFATTVMVVSMLVFPVFDDRRGIDILLSYFSEDEEPVEPVSADAWLGISSAEYDSHCGDDGSHTLEEALDGTDSWYHYVDEVHWFVLDLGQTYTIKKVRGRSLSTNDPIDVNIYIDDSNPPTTLIEEGITTWKDTNDWVEVDITDSDGRYIKVEIEDTEDLNRDLTWIGKDIFQQPLPIFDAYGDVAAAPPARQTQVNLSGLTAISGEPYITWSGNTENLPKPTFCNNSGIAYETMKIEIDVNTTTYVEQIDIWAGNLTNATIIDSIGGNNITCYVSNDNITFDILQDNWWGYGPGVFAAYPYSISNLTWNATTSPVGIDPFAYYGDGTYITTDCTLYVRFQCNLSGTLYESLYTNFTAWYVEISNNTKAWSNLEYYNGLMNVTEFTWQNVQAWNGTIYNTSSWNNIASWNGTIYNTSNWQNIQAWNGTIYNTSSWNNIASWNGTIYNVTTGWQNIQSWNGTIYNTSNWQNIEAWNGTIYNSSSWTNIETWNGTIYNTSSWNNIASWNGTIYNTSVPGNITVSDPWPPDNSTGVAGINVTLHITISHDTGLTMNITWYWDNGTYLGSTLNVGNGTYYMHLSNASNYSTTYWWSVNVTDGTEWSNHTYNFTTRASAAVVVIGGGRDRFTIGIVLGVFFGLTFILVWRRRRKRNRNESLYDDR